MKRKKRLRNSQALDRARLRARVAELLGQCKTQYEIAAIVGKHPGTVTRLIQEAREEANARAADAVEDLIRQELAQLWLLRRKLWVEFERSCEDRVRLETESVETEANDAEGQVIATKPVKSKTVREGQAGDAAIAGKLIEVHRRICELRGLDAPNRREVSGPNGKPIGVELTGPIQQVLVALDDREDFREFARSRVASGNPCLPSSNGVAGQVVDAAPLGTNRPNGNGVHLPQPNGNGNGKHPDYPGPTEARKE
ncbi:MAG: hypothetical protein WCX88_02925 [Patescibacteria group bacterium]